MLLPIGACLPHPNPSPAIASHRNGLKVPTSSPFFATSRISRFPARISTQGNTMGEEGARVALRRRGNSWQDFFLIKVAKDLESLAGFGASMSLGLGLQVRRFC